MSPVPLLNLQGSNLLEISVRTNLDFIQSVDPRTTVGYAFTASRHVSDSRLFRLELRLRIVPEDNLAKGNPYWIELAIDGYFRSNREIADKEVPAPIIENALAILYGVARGIVSTITGNGAHGKYLLPTITFSNSAEVTAPNESIVDDKAEPYEATKPRRARAPRKTSVR